MVMDKIVLKNINKSFVLNDKKVSVFEDFSMEFDPGIINVIIGKSGCGKGHEEYQAIGNDYVPFSEHKIIEELCKNI